MKLQTKELKFNKNSVNMPYMHIKGKSQGPVAFFCGGMHGDEINGILLMKNFMEWAQKENLEKKLKGEIFVLPVLNVSGFNQMQRKISEDDRDLNRSFGKEKPITYSEGLASELSKEFFSKCDFGVDCHDSGQELIMVPHTRVHDCEPDRCMTMTHNLAKYFDRKITVERKGKPEMLAVHLAEKYEISVLTVETGSTQNAFVEKNNTCLKGLINILKGMEMYPGKPILKNDQLILRDRYNIINRKAGYIDFFKKPGDYIHKGDVIGQMYYPLTHEYEDIRSPKCGMIFTQWKTYQIREGVEFFSVLETMNCGKEHKFDEKVFNSITVEKKEM